MSIEVFKARLRLICSVLILSPLRFLSFTSRYRAPQIDHQCHDMLPKEQRYALRSPPEGTYTEPQKTAAVARPRGQDAVGDVYFSSDPGKGTSDLDLCFRRRRLGRPSAHLDFKLGH